MEYRDEFIVTITSYRDLKNLFSSQGFLRFVFYDLDSAKDFAFELSDDAKRGIIPLELKTTAKTTGIIIYGAPMIFSAKSEYAHMRYYYKEKISVSADAIKRHQAQLAQQAKQAKLAKQVRQAKLAKQV